MYTYYRLELKRKYTSELGKEFQKLGYKVYTKWRVRPHREPNKLGNIECDTSIMYLRKEQADVKEIENHPLVSSYEVIQTETLLVGLVKVMNVNEKGQIMLDSNDEEDRHWFED